MGMASELSKEEWMERLRKVGRVLLGTVAIVCLVVFWPTIKQKAQNLFFKSMQSHLELTPTKIQEWIRPEAAEVFQAELLECGFQIIGDFSINQSRQNKLRGYLNPQKNVYAVMYDRLGRPALLDFYTFYEDGTSVRMTTAANPHSETPPGKQIWYIQDPMSIRQLLEKMLTERPDKPVLPVSKEAFALTLKRYLEEISLWESKQFLQ
jgi:hypothetical protein